MEKLCRLQTLLTVDKRRLATLHYLLAPKNTVTAQYLDSSLYFANTVAEAYTIFP